MLIYFLTFNTYKYAFPLFLIHLFDNDDMKSRWRPFYEARLDVEIFVELYDSTLS